jgi:hypothetical protein
LGPSPSALAQTEFAIDDDCPVNQTEQAEDIRYDDYNNGTGVKARMGSNPCGTISSDCKNETVKNDREYGGDPGQFL